MSILKILLSPIVKHWIAGEKLKDAILVTKDLNKHNIKTMINFIGEESAAGDGSIFSSI